MTLEQQQRLATIIFRILKVPDISIPVGLTQKGQLSLRFSKDKVDFEVLLDSVPLNEKEYDNRELKQTLEKYIYGEGSN